MGYMSIIGSNSSFSGFKPDKPAIDIGAMVISPQVIAEINIFEWLKIRTGLAYNFYSFEDQTVVKKDDLQNISFSFGFFFGIFN